MRNYSLIAFALILMVSTEAMGGKAFSCPDMPEDEEEVRTVAGDFFKSGSTEFKKKKFKKALKLFLSSLCITDHPNTVYNVAQSVFYLKRKGIAIKILRAYVESREESPSALEVKKIINRLEEQQGKELSYPEVGLESEIEAETAEVAVEEAEPEEVLEESGVPADQPLDDQPPEPAFQEEQLNTEEDAPEDGWILGQTKMGFSSLVLMGSGAAILIAGVVVQGLAYSAKKNAENTSDRDVFEKEHKKNRNLQAGATVCFVLGGVAAATGITLFIVDRRRRSDKAAASVSLVPTGSGLLLTGRF